MNQKLKWWQVVLFFVGFVSLIAWRVSEREQLNAPDLEERLVSLQHRACECRTRQDAECAAEARDDLARLFAEQEDRRISDEQYATFRSIVQVTERCLAQAGTPSGLAVP